MSPGPWSPLPNTIPADPQNICSVTCADGQPTVPGTSGWLGQRMRAAAQKLRTGHEPEAHLSNSTG